MKRWLGLAAILAGLSGGAAAQPANTQIIGCTNWGTAQSIPALGLGAVNCDAQGNFVGSPNASAIENTTTTAGGVATFCRLPSSAATNNATTCKVTAGRLYKITGYNASGSVRRLKLYNVATTPAPGTTAIFFTKPLPPGGFSFDQADIGWYFSTGISFALVANAADADNTAVAAGDITDLSLEYN